MKTLDKYKTVKVQYNPSKTVTDMLTDEGYEVCYGADYCLMYCKNNSYYVVEQKNCSKILLRKIY